MSACACWESPWPSPESPGGEVSGVAYAVFGDPGRTYASLLGRCVISDVVVEGRRASAGGTMQVRENSRVKPVIPGSCETST